MKIAVTYDNGKVFGHFGRTEAFKVYEVEDNNVVSSEVIDANGAGHSALATLLAENEIDVLICGGIGGCAKDTLAEVGIELCSGAEGDTDEVVEKYLKGEISNEGVNCSHHGEGHSCGDDCECDDDCECGNEEGSGCGGCCGGGCHSMRIYLEGKNAGKTCRVHYRGTFNDGTVFDSSYDRGEPIEFICGAGMMIKGFDKAVVDMAVGQKISVHLSPEEAYGMPDPELIFTVDIAELEGSEDLEAGQNAYLVDQFGRPFQVLVAARDDKTITLDANSEMAGKELNFDIELVSVE